MILKLKPTLKSYVWGGEKLVKEWHKESDKPVAESWELSFHPDGESRVVGGEFDGKRLCEVVTKAEWGANCQRFEFFPVLNKLIDAKQNLSVQVHPDDAYALKNEGQFGKTEMWYILSAEKDAFLYLGLNRALTEQEFSQAIANDTVCDCLNKVPVKSGETYFIPSGTLHAIGAGTTLFEVQQNSSLTYRVYDFGRKDAFGNTRELHVEKAKKVANLSKYLVPDAHRECLLGKCNYFSAYVYDKSQTLCRKDSFVSLTVVDGEICVGQKKLQKGETVFVTAGEKAEIVSQGKYILTCVDD